MWCRNTNPHVSSQTDSVAEEGLEVRSRPSSNFASNEALKQGNEVSVPQFLPCDSRVKTLAST